MKQSRNARGPVQPTAPPLISGTKRVFVRPKREKVQQGWKLMRLGSNRHPWFVLRVVSSTSDFLLHQSTNSRHRLHGICLLVRSVGCCVLRLLPLASRSSLTLPSLTVLTILVLHLVFIDAVVLNWRAFVRFFFFDWQNWSSNGGHENWQMQTLMASAGHVCAPSVLNWSSSTMPNRADPRNH